jgi:hypothetical protein
MSEGGIQFGLADAPALDRSYEIRAVSCDMHSGSLLTGWQAERQKFYAIARAQSLYTSFLSLPDCHSDRDAEGEVAVDIVSHQ